MTVSEALAQLLLIYSQQKSGPWSDEDIQLVQECREALDEPQKRGGIGELFRYSQIYSSYKPLIDRAKKDYEDRPELQVLVKAAAPAYKAFRDSEALMQLLATLPNILKELKAAHD